MHLTQGLHRSLRSAPDSLATISGDRVRTVAEHADRVSRLAGAFRALGVSDGDRIGILSQNSDRYAEALLAIPWANSIVVPLNIRWNEREISYALNDSETSMLIVDDGLASLALSVRHDTPELRHVVHAGEAPTPSGMVAYEDLIATGQPISDARRHGDAVAGIFYTSGTTGSPKGVTLSHANLVTAALGSQATTPIVVPGGCQLHAAPMFHLADLNAWVAQSLLGGTHVTVARFDPRAVMAAIADHHVTNTVLVPTMVQLLIDHPDRQRYDLSSLRIVLYGGSPMIEAILHRAMRALPGADFVQGYGMTELAGAATHLTPDDHRSGERLRSAGRAAAHAEVRIVDEDADVPAGTVGEIVVRGGNVMTGYWAQPDASADAVRGGWMHTGDAGYMDDRGYVFVVDRLKDMIVTGGENVYSIEVENALSHHPAVANCAVIGIPDDLWGERVHAVVVLKAGVVATVDQLRDHTRSLIGGYKVPRTIEFVDALPLSGAGKVLKRHLQVGL